MSDKISLESKAARKAKRDGKSTSMGRSLLSLSVFKTSLPSEEKRRKLYPAFYVSGVSNFSLLGLYLSNIIVLNYFNFHKDIHNEETEEFVLLFIVINIIGIIIILVKFYFLRQKEIRYLNYYIILESVVLLIMFTSMVSFAIPLPEKFDHIKQSFTYNTTNNKKNNQSDHRRSDYICGFTVVFIHAVSLISIYAFQRRLKRASMSTLEDFSYNTPRQMEAGNSHHVKTTTYTVSPSQHSTHNTVIEANDHIDPKAVSEAHEEDTDTPDPSQQSHHDKSEAVATSTKTSTDTDIKQEKRIPEPMANENKTEKQMKDDDDPENLFLEFL